MAPNPRRRDNSKHVSLAWSNKLVITPASQAELHGDESWITMSSDEIEQEVGTSDYDEFMESYSSSIRADMARMLANDPDRLFLWTLHQDFVVWNTDWEDDASPSNADDRNWVTQRLHASGFNPTLDQVDFFATILRQEQPTQGEQERAKTQGVILEGVPVRLSLSQS